jgi:hypothetical protein
MLGLKKKVLTEMFNRCTSLGLKFFIIITVLLLSYLSLSAQEGRERGQNSQSRNVGAKR